MSKNLREYLTTEFGMPEHRETEDFVLEILKTQKANHKLSTEWHMAMIQMLDTQQKVKDLITVVRYLNEVDKRAVASFQAIEAKLKEAR